AGAYGGATLSEGVAIWLRQWSIIAAYSEPLALFLVVSAITFFSLFIGELVPKAIALSHPEGIASVLAPPMATVARIGTPVVYLLSVLTQLVLRVLRIKPETEHNLTEEEIRALVKQATVAGEVEPVEQRIVDQVFVLGDRRVRAIMTPRHEIEWLD